MLRWPLTAEVDKAINRNNGKSLILPTVVVSNLKICGIYEHITSDACAVTMMIDSETFCTSSYQEEYMQKIVLLKIGITGLYSLPNT